MSFTLDPRMVQLPHVKEYQEEAVWQVLQHRCQELIVEEQEKVSSCAVVGPRAETSSASTNSRQILGCTKQHGHHFPTLSQLARRFLAISATSCPVERLFSVAGQVDADRRASLAPDTLTLLVFLHEALPLVRKIRASRIVRQAIEH